MFIEFIVFIVFITLVATYQANKCDRSDSYFTFPCDWSSMEAFSNKSALCTPFILTDTNFSILFKKTNFYFIGNSVTRHYSFNVKYILDGYISEEKKLSREEEKIKCGGLLDTNSCYHVTENGEAFIQFYWMNTIGENPDQTDDRDICHAQRHAKNITTESCLRGAFTNATDKDILIISSILVNSTNYVGSFQKWDKFFLKIIESQNTLTNSQATIQMVSQVFPGRIIWLPYPSIGLNNREVEAVNDATREAVEGMCSDRVIFLNTYAMLQDHRHLYKDAIHHPGLLSDMVISAVFSTLKN